MEYDIEEGRPTWPDEVKALLRAYTALALARHAAALYKADAPADPYLSAIVNNQELAMRELDTVLDRTISEVGSVAAPLEAEEEYSLVM